MIRLDFFWHSGFECPQEPSSSPFEVQVVVWLTGVGELPFECRMDELGVIGFVEDCPALSIYNDGHLLRHHQEVVVFH